MAKATNTEIIDLLGEKFGEQLFDVTEPYGLLTFSTTKDASTLWNAANWMERETYDFFGIKFEGHPDLRRILNMDDLGVHPMLKQYPLEDPNRVDKKDEYFGR
ncbi:MAG: NADH-quinone oxidoreductase subunit C [Pedobacter sp.]|nr:MAG: NADH-quinone oxidoreductase subunit C [Pedobacter sp.]